MTLTAVALVKRLVALVPGVDANTVVLTSLNPVNVPMEINLGLLDFVFEKMGHAVQFEQRVLPAGEVSVTCRG